ncbi:hypothetical protein [Reyranella sp.]|uniref:hypothetical protein n=1 Tax=Reyranella sp. TaxID=1929291 RepID=UPI0012EAF2DF
MRLLARHPPFGWNTLSSRRRVDRESFFQVVLEAHGVQIRPPTIDAAWPRGATAEKRLVRTVKSCSTAEPFALRRLFARNPTVNECVFPSAAMDGAQQIAQRPSRAARLGVAKACHLPQFFDYLISA